MVFRASSVYPSTLTVHCMSSFLLVRPVDLFRRQLALRFLIYLVHDEDRGVCINQENQVGYDSGGGVIIFIFKINESWYIALFLVNRSIEKLFSIDVNIFFFLNIFSIDIAWWKSVELTHIAYIVFPTWYYDCND